MEVIFCEECGGKNLVAEELLEKIEQEPLLCQICGVEMSEESIISYMRSTGTTNTLQYHLLFIDDDLFHLQLMKSSLEKEYTVSIASTGMHGIELAAEHQPDLILLDVVMPHMDGHEVCRQLKQNPETRKIPVIFVSAMEGDNDEYLGFTLGAVDYLSKPINLQILNARIGVQIRLKQLLEKQEVRSDQLIQSFHESNLKAEAMHEKMYRERNDFSSILDYIPEQITIEDLEKRIIWANRAALKATGKSLSQVSGLHCHEVFCSSDTTCASCPFADASMDNMFVPIPLDSAQEDSDYFQTHIPFFDDEGEFTGQAHIVVKDVKKISGGDANNGIPAEIGEYLFQQRDAMQKSISTILFGVDALISSCRGDRELVTMGRVIIGGAEKLDEMMRALFKLQEK